MEENEITRIGGHESIRINARSVFATAKNLEEAVKEGSFRGDLYYRINIVPIILPLLRERGEDIMALTEYFLGIFTDKYNKKGLVIQTPVVWNHWLTITEKICIFLMPFQLPLI